MKKDDKANWEKVLDQLVEFSWRAGTDACYRKWPIQRVREYVVFHIRQGTFVFLRTFGIQDVCGTAVAWQTQEAALRLRLGGGGHAFDWKPTDPTGDCVFVADVVTTKPGALKVLIAALVRKFPQWRTLKVFTFRQGKLVEYKQRLVDLVLADHGKELYV